MASPDPLYLATQDDHEDPTVRSIARKERLLLQTITELGDTVFSQDPQKTFSRRWPIGQVADMVGASRQMIRFREKEGDLPQPELLPNGRYAGYSLEDINTIRDFFATRPRRGENDEPAVLSFSALKSNQSKTSLSAHLAQYLAMRGYRVLFIDLDPNAAASALFGLNTDLELLHWHYESAQVSAKDPNATRPLNYTLDEYLSHDFREFANAIRASYFPGIDLVPSSMALSEVEYQLVALTQSKPDRLNDLRRGIQSVWSNYDVVILDPPPTRGPLSEMAQRAANALVLPVQPTRGDVASTAMFLSKLTAQLADVARTDEPVHYGFETMLVNNLDEDQPTHVEIVEELRKRVAAGDLLSAMMSDSTIIDRAARQMNTLYDQAPPRSKTDPYAIAVSQLDRLNEELEMRIRRTWPSHRQALLKEARI